MLDGGGGSDDPYDSPLPTPLLTAFSHPLNCSKVRYSRVPLIWNHSFFEKTIDKTTVYCLKQEAKISMHGTFYRQC